MSGCRLVQVLLACGVAFALSPVGARAQEPARQAQPAPRFGLTISYPTGGAQVGLVWEKSERWAIRPEFTFSFTSRSATVASAPTTSDNWSGGVAVMLLRYVAKKDSARAYVGPRFAYTRFASNNGVSDTASNVYGIGASAGLLYSLTARIAVFGETGLAYSYTTNSYTGASVQDARTHSVGTRAALGLNLYF